MIPGWHTPDDIIKKIEARLAALRQLAYAEQGKQLYTLKYKNPRKRRWSVHRNEKWVKNLELTLYEKMITQQL